MDNLDSAFDASIGSAGTGTPEESYSETRQKERIALICAKEGWPPRLPFDLAMQLESAEETFARYEVNSAQGAKLLENPVFVSVIKVMRDAIVNEGVSFRQKAKLAAEELLSYAYDIATDPQASTAVRADLIKWHAKIAGLEPVKEAGGDGEGGGSAFSLVIKFAGTPTPSVLEGRVQPVTDADIVPDTSAAPKVKSLAYGETL